MPHIHLEFSSNIIEKDKIVDLFRKIHISLAENLPTNITSCKSSAKEYTTYLIGHGNETDAFIHCTVKMLSGRSMETKKKTSDHLSILLKETFKESAKKLQLQITIALCDLPEAYFKY